MLRRSSPTITLLAALSALLLGCGNPSSDQANDASQDDEAVVDASADNGKAEDAGEEAYSEDQASDEEGSGYDGAPPPSRHAGGTGGPAPVATREVGAGVRGDVSMFYNDLARDGAWVYHPDYSYVWIPSRMGPGWRPYQEGRWIWTNDYGWYWESEEPFAWAVYHYGRWDYDPAYGWFWVPGDTWAPAWVTWRYGGGAVGWAPIAPDRPGFATGLPRRYAPPIAEAWVFVEARDFTAPDIGQYALPISRIGPSLAGATDIRTPRYQNGRVMNFGASRDEVQRYVRGPIQSRELVYVGNPDHMFDDVRGRRVGIYRPVIADDGPRRKPPTVVEVTKSGRVIVREYAPVAGTGYDVPSAALLDVLDDGERKSLRETRLTAKEAAVDQRLKQLRQERAALLKEREDQAAKLEAKLEQERKRAMAERRRNRELLREARRQRGEDAKLDAGTAPPAKPDVAPPVEAAVPAEPAAPKKTKPSAPAPVETGTISEPERAKAPSGEAKAPRQEATPAAPTEVLPQPAPAAEATPEAAPPPKRAKAQPAPAAQPEQEAVAPPASPEAPAAAPMPPPADAVEEAPRKQRKQRPPQDAEAAPAAPVAPMVQPEAEAPAAIEQVAPPQAPSQGQDGDRRKKQGRASASPEESGAAPEPMPQMQPPPPASVEPDAAPAAPE
jgi:Family of unknown function (DUF6600)